MLGFKQMGDRHLDSWHSLPFTNPLHQPPLHHIPILSFSPLHCFFSFLSAAISLAGRWKNNKSNYKITSLQTDLKAGREEWEWTHLHIFVQKQVKVLDSSPWLHVFVSMWSCACNVNTRPANLTGSGISIWWAGRAPHQLTPVFLLLTLPSSVSLPVPLVRFQVCVAFHIGAFYKIIYSLAFTDPGYLWLLWHRYTYTKFYLAAPQGFWVSVIAVTAKPASFSRRKCMAHGHTLAVNLE